LLAEILGKAGAGKDFGSILSSQLSFENYDTASLAIYIKYVRCRLGDNKSIRIAKHMIHMRA